MNLLNTYHATLFEYYMNLGTVPIWPIWHSTISPISMAPRQFTIKMCIIPFFTGSVPFIFVLFVFRHRFIIWKPLYFFTGSPVEQFGINEFR